MSFQIFKQSMLSYMSNQESIESYNDFAAKITKEYDMCIKRGLQTINQIPIQKGNNNLMEALVKVACATALGKKDGLHTFGDDIGKAVVGYWSGAVLVTGIPPVIPADFKSLANITSTSAPVTNPGTWSPIGPLNPTDNIGLFLDRLIAHMQIHITTVKGIYVTLSLYPGAPPFVGPGILNWTGFTIPG